MHCVVTTSEALGYVHCAHLIPSPILQMRRLRLRGAKSIAQGHTTGKCRVRIQTRCIFIKPFLQLKGDKKGFGATREDWKGYHVCWNMFSGLLWENSIKGGELFQWSPLPQSPNVSGLHGSSASPPPQSLYTAYLSLLPIPWLTTSPSSSPILWTFLLVHGFLSSQKTGWSADKLATEDDSLHRLWL